MHGLEEDNEVSLKGIFKEFSKIFHHPNAIDFMSSLDDPLKGGTLGEMLDIIKKTRSRLSEKLESMYQDSQLSKERVEKFVSNPDNFSKQEWEAMQSFKKEMDNYVKEFQVASQGAGIREIVMEGRKRAQRKKTKLERQNSSNKKWIPMS
jgi:hypothetical protein